MLSNKKRTLIALGILLVVALGIYFIARPAPSDATYENLIENGSFLDTDAEGMPASWYTSSYFHKDETAYDVTEEGAHIVNSRLNDARFAQTVSVAPDTLYCLRGYIKAETEGGRGANLSIEDVYAFSESVYSTGGEWQEVVLYGRTGQKQDRLTVYARLGGYSGESVGEAWFRDITLNRVDTVPEGYFAEDFFPYQNENAAASAAGETTGAFTIALTCLAYCAAFFFLKKRLPQGPVYEKKKGQAAAALCVMLLAFASRLIAALTVPGYDVDIGCFISWANHMAEVGPVNFYNTISFCDYPPGYMNILWVIGILGKMLGGVTEWMVKMPAVLCDVMICLVLYREGKMRANHRTGLLVALFFALNPVSFVSGACWGQTDSLMALLLLVAVVNLLRSRWMWALPAYVAAVLMKPQALMFGPMGVAALVLHLKNEKCSKKSLKDVGMGLCLSLMVFCVLALPFIVNIQGEKTGLSFLLNLYGNTMGSYGYTTINACNPYFLLGLNWYPSENNASVAAMIVTVLLSTVPALFACLQNRKQPWKKDFSLLCTAGLSGLLFAVVGALFISNSLTYASLSTCMIVYAVALCCVQFLIKGDMKQLPVIAAAMLILLFCCAGMMHERYLFPVVVLLMLGYALTRDRRLLSLSLLVTLASFINIACVLDRNIRIGGVEAHLTAPLCAIESDMTWLEYLSALLTSLSALLCVYTALSPAPAIQEAKRESAVQEKQPAPAYEKPHIPAFTLRDFIIMLCGTVLYAVLAFTNLGSLKAPETAWVTKSDTESVLVDLGEERTFSVLYHQGIHWQNSTFTVEAGTDQLIWDSRDASLNYGDCFKWQYVTGTNHTPLTGRYLRITAGAYDQTIHEIILRDYETKEAIPYTIIENYANETVNHILDEQDTLEGEPGWYNSTYFDEIYHARTGYEHLHSLPTYETSHPPLGKVFISWAIGIFGMNPFGWRFAGTLAGVLMLPGMYLLGHLLIKKKWGGAFAMLMMAFDTMHFTQTRIATIDSFVVLFIIWAVYCMLYWFQMDFYGKPFWKTLVPLGLSGLFFGLSIASKWTGVYNGVGLAVLFFWGIWRRFNLWKDAKAIPAAKRTEEEKKTAAKGHTLLLSVASCLVFFIAIPLLIYYLSYIPYFAWEGGVTVKKVIEAAVGDYFTTGQVGGMLGYHGQPGLGMDHDFYSPWYEWPIIAKPMWYWNSSYNTPEASSTLMALGNPGVWWVCLAGLVGMVLLFIFRRVRCDVQLTEDRQLTGGLSFALWPREDDARYGLILICFLAQFVPWVLVPRGTYIYHYFPSIPFIILATSLCLERLQQKWQKAGLILVIAVLAAAIFLFIAFFPYASGAVVPQAWLESMKWFPRWLWY
ncbi:MAG: glycosyltransferase family 39 protein [Clostridia bacterium]|nr:glycosyltransferase family 39 protein [Clostridia bacterium]